MSGRKVRTADCRRCKIWRSLKRSGLPASSTQAICERMWLNRVRKRQLLYSEGNQATHLYAIRAGSVKLTRSDASGREHITAILESGSLFGFEAAFDEAYVTGAEVHADSELCLLPAGDLRQLIQDVPGLGADIARYLHRRLVSADQRLAFLGNPGAQSRMAGYLLWRLPEDSGRPRCVPHELTQRELGGMLGLSAETVCRTLRLFEAEGLLAQRPGEILLHDVDALAQLAAH